jgi:GNAT superfamily N-acetyltransferase
MNIDLSRINIRKVGPDDVATLTEHRLNYLAGLQGEREETYKSQLRTALEDYFRKSMADGSFYAVMAEYENEPVAFGGMIVKKIPGDFNKASYTEGEILNMYTVPEARRKGISTLILTRLLNDAEKAGISKVSLHTSKEGERLYRKFGFKEPDYPVLEFCIR